MISFAGTDIPGTHESPVRAVPNLQKLRSEFFGVIGESELTGGRKGRAITIRILIHNRYSQSGALMQFLFTLDQLVGTNGVLQIQNGPYGGVQATYPACTFEGFANDSSPDAGPLPDMTGALDGSAPSWWIQGTLNFYQLNVSSASANG